MSKINSMLRWVEHEESFKSSGLSSRIATMACSNQSTMLHRIPRTINFVLAFQIIILCGKIKTMALIRCYLLCFACNVEMSYSFELSMKKFHNLSAWFLETRYIERYMRFPTSGMCDQQSLRSACAYAQSDQSLCLSLDYSMIVKLLTEHHLEFLSLKGGCTGSSESTHVRMPHCWKSHVTVHFLFCVLQVDLRYASIQEEDISMYVVITGFVISNVSSVRSHFTDANTDKQWIHRSHGQIQRGGGRGSGSTPEKSQKYRVS